MPHTYESAGSYALRRWLRKTKTTQTALARAIGRTQGQISSWRSGARKPHGAARAELCLETGIRPSAWDRAPRVRP